MFHKLLNDIFKWQIHFLSNLIPAHIHNHIISRFAYKTGPYSKLILKIKNCTGHKPNSTIRRYISSNIRPTYQGGDKSSRRISLIWPLDTDSRDKTLSGFLERGGKMSRTKTKGAKNYFYWTPGEGESDNN